MPRWEGGRAAARADWFRPRRRQHAYLAARAANRLEEGSCIRPAPAGRSRPTRRAGSQPLATWGPFRDGALQRRAGRGERLAPVSATTGLPELDVARVQRWCVQRVPDHARHQVRVECEVEPRRLTIVERRAPWHPDVGPEWTRFPIAGCATPRPARPGRYTGATATCASTPTTASPRRRTSTSCSPRSTVTPPPSSGADPSRAAVPLSSGYGRYQRRRRPGRGQPPAALGRAGPDQRRQLVLRPRRTSRRCRGPRLLPARRGRRRQRPEAAAPAVSHRPGHPCPGPATAPT